MTATFTALKGGEQSVVPQSLCEKLKLWPQSLTA
jgi:hypothetical protein